MTLRAGRLLLALACSAVCAASARADVYMWTDPQTGQRRMSNIAPPWLLEPPPAQSARRQPKVEVMRERRVMDAESALATPAPPPPRTTQVPAATPAATRSAEPKSAAKPDNG